MMFGPIALSTIYLQHLKNTKKAKCHSHSIYSKAIGLIKVFTLFGTATNICADLLDPTTYIPLTLAHPLTFTCDDIVQ